jgi:hypothetical protein
MSAAITVTAGALAIACASGFDVHLGETRFGIDSASFVAHNHLISNRGALWGISSSNQPDRPTGLHFEFAGIGFDDVRDVPFVGDHWWTLYISLWWMIPAMMPGLAFVGIRLFSTKAPPGICSHCGYDMRATPQRCTECGKAATDTPRSRGAILLSKWLRIPGYVLLFYVCFLIMMPIHELGHVLHALLSGGRVEHVEFGLLEFSRTDVSVNPHPQFVAWGGPLWGSAIPLIIYAIIVAARSRFHRLCCFFAGFCLIVNGGYIGLGWIDRVGDAGTLLRHGAPVWSLVVSGWLALLGGLYLWHRMGPHFGFVRLKRANSLEQTAARG